MPAEPHDPARAHDPAGPPDPSRAFLRHTLGTLAYRCGKVTRGPGG
jgi:hypothetical protein